MTKRSQSKSSRNTGYRVLVLSHISELLGGAERSMLDVFDYLAEHFDVRPEFILRERIRSLGQAIEERGWKYYPLNFTFWSDSNPPKTDEEIFYNAVQNAKAVTAIEQIIKDTKPDLVMTNSIVSPWAALAAHFQQVPHIWFIREYGDLDHGRTFEIGRERSMADVANLSALVVANSDTLAKHLVQYMDKTKVTTLYTPFKVIGLREQLVQPVSSPFKHRGSLKLILAGNLAVSKGQLEAVRAVGMLVKEGFNVELCLVGKEGEAEFMKMLHVAIEEFGITNRVHLVGFQTSPIPYVALSDVGIMPSRMEAFGRVTFEYLLAGKAVVGANSGATPEMVKNELNGYLFEPQNANSLANALRKYAEKPELIKTHGKASSEQAERMLQSEANIEALFKRISNIVEKQTLDIGHPIHFLHRFLEYLEIGRRSIESSQVTSIHYIVRSRTRRKLKSAYLRAKRFRTKLWQK